MVSSQKKNEITIESSNCLKSEETKAMIEEDISTNYDSTPFREKQHQTENEAELFTEHIQKALPVQEENPAPVPKQPEIEMNKPEPAEISKEHLTRPNERLSSDEAFIEKYSGRGESDPLECFPCIYSMLPHPVAIQIAELMRSNDGFNPTVSADHSFALFLYQISKKSNSEFYNTVLRTVMAFRDCINSHGYMILSQYSQETFNISIMEALRNWHCPVLPQMKLSASISAEYIFLCAEFFLKQYLPSNFANWVNKEFALDLIFIMNKWMVEKSLSKVLVSFS